MIYQLLLSLLLGFLVGVEREFVGKEAGTKTYSLVAFGATLFTILAQTDAISLDAGKVISQIITGIGFICAGLIIFHENKVRGLTTAAALWVMSGVGIAVGLGEYELAIASTVIVVIVLFALRKLNLEEKIHTLAGLK